MAYREQTDSVQPTAWRGTGNAWAHATGRVRECCACAPENAWIGAPTATAGGLRPTGRCRWTYGLKPRSAPMPAGTSPARGSRTRTSTFVIDSSNTWTHAEHRVRGSRGIWLPGPTGLSPCGDSPLRVFPRVIRGSYPHASRRDLYARCRVMSALEGSRVKGAEGSVAGVCLCVGSWRLPMTLLENPSGAREKKVQR